jgi:hypothetical protein
MRGVGKAMKMDSTRAAKYLGGGSKNAKRLLNKGVEAAATAKAAGNAKAIADEALFARNASIRARQRQIGMRYGAGAAGLGALGTQKNNRSSYTPPRPMTQGPSGSGRYA